jgi:MarR family transcriptional regulator, organic hydroperoxide resistance regulator
MNIVRYLTKVGYMKNNKKNIWPGFNDHNIFDVSRLDYSIVVGIFYLRNEINCLVNAELPPQISSQQIEVLTQIAYEKLNTATDISKTMRISKATVTDHIQRLEKKGYVKREVSPIDQRIKIIFLTAKGKKVTEKVVPQFLTSMKNILGGISKREKVVINESLITLFKAIDNHK